MRQASAQHRRDNFGGGADQLADWDEDNWNNHPSSAPVSNSSSGAQATETADDKGEDYAYVADVVRDSDLNYDAFAVIENRHHSAVSSPLHRRLLFDTVIELVDRKRQLAPWDAFCRSIPAGGGTYLIKEVWEELLRIQEHDGAGDAMEVTRAVIRKDLAAPANGEQGWGCRVRRCPPQCCTLNGSCSRIWWPILSGSWRM
ncbi:hypothetical protein KSP40_PGU022641 [Platanthera guangdongensis]|uniref:DUF4378 domain-containing protein n=1 Tax=Platanthera guangdongensis TaxID=2320717 RepID=A0ABR2LDM8_9ASPA